MGVFNPRGSPLLRCVTSLAPHATGPALGLPHRMRQITAAKCVRIAWSRAHEDPAGLPTTILRRAESSLAVATG